MAQGRLDLQWALFYGSNWHLITSSQDYFVHGAGASLVHHTWSLAIEEQFYLAWPLVVTVALWLACPDPRARGDLCRRHAWVGCRDGLLHSSSDPSRAYYGTDARIHQLLIGALLAVAMVSVNDHLCPNGLCHHEANGLLPRYDAHHYSSAGARWVVGLLFEQMQLAGVWPLRGTA